MLSKILFLFFAIGLFGLAALFAQEGAVTGLSYATFGLGIILVLVVINLVPLVLAFLPAVILPDAARFNFLILGALLYAAYLWLPSYLVKEEVRQVEVTFAQEDIGPLDLSGPIAGIELHYTAEVPAQVCNRDCRAILLGGRSDWVRMIFNSASTRETNRPTFLFVRTLSDEDPATRNDIINIPDDGRQAEYVVREVGRDGLIERFEEISPRRFVVPNYSTALEVAKVRSDGEETVLRLEGLSYQFVGAPTLLTPRYINSTTTRGFEVVRRQTSEREVTHRDLLTRLGWIDEAVLDGETEKDRDEPPRLSSSDISLAQRILASDVEDEAFPRSDQVVLKNVIDLAASSELGDVERELVFQIIRDSRLTLPARFDLILKNDAQLRAEMLPWIIENWFAEDTLSVQTLRLLKGSLRYVYSIAEISVYSDQITKLLEVDGYEDRQLISLIGRIGMDPLGSYLKVIELNDGNLFAAKTVFCAAEPQWYETLVDPTIQLLKTAPVRGDYPYHQVHYRDLARMLASLGRSDEVIETMVGKNVEDEKFFAQLREADGDLSWFGRACA